MTAPIPTLRAHKTNMGTEDAYRLDRFIEKRLDRKRRVENIALVALAVGCVAGIVLIGKFG